jgi:glutamate formiminotransferase / formiminotetrahydrofolate cyclodeaminase
MKIIECVPNLSEGRNKITLEKIKNSLKGIPDCRILNFEPDDDYNRTVITFAGNESGILEGALAVSRTASQEIDMRNHKGEHPRIGAIDVVPFIPIKNTSIENCIRISERYGKIIAEELNVPVFLYESSARKPERITLSNIRKGEYEGLQEKLKDENWKPDFGPSEFNPRLGAIVTGARFFLIAYNVNIKSEDVKYAKEISEIIRESGTSKKDKDGKPVKESGQIVREAGRLKNIRGMGVKLEKFDITQVSMNLTNYNITPLHIAYEEVKKEAERLGIKVSGSEIVGLVPLEALLLAGKYYAQDQNMSEDSMVDLAIDKLGLNGIRPFIKKEKIIDYLIKDFI